MSLSKKFTRREIVLLIVLSLLVILALYYFAVQQPVADTGDELDQQITGLEDEMIMLEAKQQRRADMLAELEDLRANSSTIAEIPSSDNLRNIMAYLDMVLAGTRNYELSSKGIEYDEDTPGGISRRRLALSFVSDSYTAAKAAVARIQDCPYLCHINTMDMTPFNAEKLTAAQLAEWALSLENRPVQVSVEVTFYERLDPVAK